MIAYCWATGLIQFGRTMPEGAIEVARGGAKKLREVVSVVARHGYAKGQLLVPGVPEADTQQEKGDALAAWLKWCAQSSRGVRFNVLTEHVGVTLESAAIRSCRECGCTETSACRGGCSWVGANLCSACVRN